MKKRINDRRICGGLVIAALVTLSVAAAACGVTTQQEVQLGAQQAGQVNQQLPIVTDADLSTYINQLGNQLAAHGARQDIPWHFYIVNTDVVNAMSLPGGYVYINRGIVSHAANASELAGVVAHEIGHVEHRDQVTQLERQQGANVGLTLAYVLLGRQASAVEQAGLQVAGSAVFAHYDRGMESNADAESINLTTRTGYSPEGLVTFFQKLMNLQRSQPNVINQMFATHPTDEQRIQAAQQLINQTVPRATLNRLQTDSKAFQTFKARMARYPAAPAQYRTQ
jgi:predicted Zn-dependent protease